MRGHLPLTNCIEDEGTGPNIELALKEDRLLWLDLQDTDDKTQALLREVVRAPAPQSPCGAASSTDSLSCEA